MSRSPGPGQYLRRTTAPTGAALDGHPEEMITMPFFDTTVRSLQNEREREIERRARLGELRRRRDGRLSRWRRVFSR
jgi:hypothetical protein